MPANEDRDSSRAAHTPGPWRALCLKEYTRVTRDRQGRGDETGSVQICHIAGPEDADLRPYNKARWEADARLIASAPSMQAEIDRLRWSLTEIASHDLIGLTGPARIVAEAMRNVARAALSKSGA